MKYYYQAKDEVDGFSCVSYIRNINFFRFNWHPEFELLLQLQGKSNVHVNENVYPLSEDDLILINANKGHTVISDSINSTACVFRFPMTSFSAYLPKNTKIRILCISKPETKYDLSFRILRYYIAQMMLSPVLAQEISKPLIVKGAYFSFLGSLLNFFPYKIESSTETKNNVKNMKLIHKMIDYIVQNYSQKISLQQLADYTNYNRTYLSSFFKANVGLTFYDYLTKLRFRHALYQLSNSNKTIAEIATDCGFSDYKNFSNYYKKTLHLLPSQHPRNIEKDVPEPIYDFLDLYQRCISTSDEYIKKKLLSYISQVDSIDSYSHDRERVDKIISNLKNIENLGEEIIEIVQRCKIQE